MHMLFIYLFLQIDVHSFNIFLMKVLSTKQLFFESFINHIIFLVKLC